MKVSWKRTAYFILILAGSILVSACGRLLEGNRPSEGGPIRVVVTTTFIGDVVENIAGDGVEITRLLAVGQNPHSYQPSPRDMVAVTEAGTAGGMVGSVPFGSIMRASKRIPSGEMPLVEKLHAKRCFFRHMIVEFHLIISFYHLLRIHFHFSSFVAV